jgi:hypothetical protein
MRYFSIIEAYQKFDRFPEQQQPIANTHSHTEHLYNAMLDEFKKIDAVNRSWNLTKEELASFFLLLRAASKCFRRVFPAYYDSLREGNSQINQHNFLFIDTAIKFSHSMQAYSIQRHYPDM